MNIKDQCEILADCIDSVKEDLQFINAEQRSLELLAKQIRSAPLEEQPQMIADFDRRLAVVRQRLDGAFNKESIMQEMQG